MSYRFRHKIYGTVVTHGDPDWSKNHRHYEPVEMSPAEASEAHVPLDGFTKAELVDLARERNLAVSGTKAELIERLS